MRVYFLSGLGADSRAFRYLSLPTNCEPIFIDWLIPQSKESLREYARRISSFIDRREPFILVGLSFGGILANEIIEFVSPVKTILISSVACRKELPLYYRIAGFLRLNQLLPAKAVNRPGIITNYIFGIETESDRKLLAEILTTTNSSFSKWAVNEVLNWKRKSPPSGIIRIHGDKDRVLPLKKTIPHYLIKNGGHFMIANRAREVSELLKRILDE